MNGGLAGHGRFVPGNTRERVPVGGSGMRVVSGVRDNELVWISVAPFYLFTGRTTF